MTSKCDRITIMMMILVIFYALSFKSDTSYERLRCSKWIRHQSLTVESWSKSFINFHAPLSCSNLLRGVHHDVVSILSIVLLLLLLQGIECCCCCCCCRGLNVVVAAVVVGD